VQPLLPLAALALLLAATPVFADVGDAAAAEVLFREGRTAADAGDFAIACKKFHESHRLDPAPGTLLNIADCEERLGRLATAWTAYRAVVQKLPANDSRHELALERAQALEPRLPRLAIALAPGAPAGTEVRRDGVELKSASLDTPLPVDPGEHVIEVTAPGRALQRYELKLAEAERVRRVVEPGAEIDEGGPGGVVDSRSGSSGGRTLGYALGGVGVLGIAAGTVTALLVLDRKSTVDDNCDADKRCNQTGADAADSGRTLGTISGASFVIGGLALAAGAWLVLTSDPEGRPQTAIAIGPDRVSVRASF
jgi:hypothetical protein